MHEEQTEKHRNGGQPESAQECERSARQDSGEQTKILRQDREHRFAERNSYRAADDRATEDQEQQAHDSAIESVGQKHAAQDHHCG